MEKIPTRENLEQVLQEARKHIEKMSMPHNDEYRVCIDGRYKENDAAAIAIPGGDAGLVLALAETIQHDVKTAYKIVADFLESKHHPFCFHTDEHEGQDGVIIGCGHLNTSIVHNHHYEFEEQTVHHIIEQMNNDHDTDEKHTHKVILEGGHDEKAVLVNKSLDYTIKPLDGETGNQYFIYDQAKYFELIDELTEFANSHNYDIDTIDENEFKKIAQSQAEITLSLLGSSKGKYMLETNFDENGNLITLESLGTVPVKE